MNGRRRWGVMRALAGAQGRVTPLSGAILAAIVGFALFLLALVVTGHLWRAIAYGTVVLFALLGLLAVYFWGALVFGGLFEALSQRRRAVVWDTGLEPGVELPAYDLDPGLELLAAGMLVYRLGQVKPEAYFRKVPLAEARAIRPFVVVRTGDARRYQFAFRLNDETDVTRFADSFSVHVPQTPQVVVPPYRLLLDRPRRLVGQRWTLQIRSGVTVITTFRFLFVEGAAQAAEDGRGVAGQGSAAESAWQQTLLPRLLDEAVKHDALTSTQEITLEVM